MASYSFRIKRSAAKELEALPPKDRRQGGYRILYEIIDKQLVVTVVKVGNRRDVYS